MHERGGYKYLEEEDNLREDIKWIPLLEQKEVKLTIQDIDIKDFRELVAIQETLYATPCECCEDEVLCPNPSLAKRGICLFFVGLGVMLSSLIPKACGVTEPLWGLVPIVTGVSLYCLGLTCCIYGCCAYSQIDKYLSPEQIRFLDRFEIMPAYNERNFMGKLIHRLSKYINHHMPKKYLVEVLMAHTGLFERESQIVVQYLSRNKKETLNYVRGGDFELGLSDSSPAPC